MILRRGSPLLDCEICEPILRSNDLGLVGETLHICNSFLAPKNHKSANPKKKVLQFQGVDYIYL